MDSRRLRLCRFGFLLIAAGFFLELLVFLFSAFAVDPETKGDEFRTPPLFVYALVMGSTCLAHIPGTGLLFYAQQSKRWRQSALFLLAVNVVQLILLGVLAMYREPNVVPEEPESLLIRVTLHVHQILSWLAFWWICVIIGEFAIAVRTELLLQNSEFLGYIILFGLTISTACAGWFIPAPIQPKATTSDATDLLLLAEILCEISALLLTLQYLTRAAVLARFLGQQSAKKDPGQGKAGN